MVDSVCLTVWLICQFIFHKEKFQKWSRYCNHRHFLSCSTWKRGLRLLHKNIQYPSGLPRPDFFQLHASCKLGIRPDSKNHYPVHPNLTLKFLLPNSRHIFLLSLVHQSFQPRALQEILNLQQGTNNLEKQLIIGPWMTF